MDFAAALPSELSIMVFSLLDSSLLLRCSHVSKLWRLDGICWPLCYSLGASFFHLTMSGSATALTGAGRQRIGLFHLLRAFVTIASTGMRSLRGRHEFLLELLTSLGVCSWKSDGGPVHTTSFHHCVGIVLPSLAWHPMV